MVAGECWEKGPLVIRSIRERMRDDDGFTLVEMISALIVLTVALSGLAAAAIAGVRSTQSSAVRSAALELAQQELERLRTMDWDYVGHYADESGWGSGYASGESLVKVSASTPSPRPADVPYLAAVDHVVDGVTYQVTTRVTWAGSSSTSPNDGTTYAAKRLSVSVSWTYKGKTDTVSLQGLRSPNAREVKPPGSVTYTAIQILNPSVGPAQTLTSGGATTKNLVLLASTDVIAASVAAVYTLSTGQSATVDLTPDATYKYWTATLPIGSGPFAPGTTTFTFTATHASGTTGTATADVSLQEASVPFALTGASATTANPQLVTGYYTQAAINLSVSASTTASSVDVTYPLQGGTTSSPIALTYSGGAWVGSVPVGTGPLTPGSLTLTFSGTSATGATATTTAVVTLTEPTLGAISIMTPTVSPSFKVSGTGKLTSATTVTVEVLNVDALTGAVTIKVGSLSTQTATALGTTGTSGGQLFKITLAKNTVIGTATPIAVVVNVTRSADGATKSGTYSFPVA